MTVNPLILATNISSLS